MHLRNKSNIMCFPVRKENYVFNEADLDQETNQLWKFVLLGFIMTAKLLKLCFFRLGHIQHFEWMEIFRSGSGSRRFADLNSLHRSMLTCLQDQLMANSQQTQSQTRLIVFKPWQIILLHWSHSPALHHWKALGFYKHWSSMLKSFLCRVLYLQYSSFFKITSVVAICCRSFQGSTSAVQLFSLNIQWDRQDIIIVNKHQC